MKKNFVLLLLLLLSILSFCQPSITRTESQLGFVGSPRKNTINYTIKNTTKDTIYIWIQNNNTDDKINSFRQYFYSETTDFPLSMLCFDGNVYFDVPFIPVLGTNFIKRLFPNESFYIYLLNCDMDSAVIHYELLKNIKKVAPPECLDKYGFIHDYIVLDTIDF